MDAGFEYVSNAQDLGFRANDVARQPFGGSGSIFPLIDLKVGNTFPDFELSDQDGKSQKLSKLIRGFPTVLIFSRGYY